MARTKKVQIGAAGDRMALGEIRVTSDVRGEGLVVSNELFINKDGTVEVRFNTRKPAPQMIELLERLIRDIRRLCPPEEFL